MSQTLCVIIMATLVDIYDYQFLNITIYSSNQSQLSKYTASHAVYNDMLIYL